MRRLTKIGIVALVLALAAGLAAIAQTGTQDVAIGGIAIDQPAPDFTLKDIDGKEYKLSSFKGKYVVLEWINFDCPFVKKHYSSGNMQTLQAEATKKGVIWLSICSSAPGKQGHFPIADLKKRMATEKAVPTAYLIDENGAVGKLYGAKTTPHMFVIDSIGKLRYAGAIDDMPSTKVDDIPKATNYVRAALDAVTSGRAVAVKSQTPYGCSVKF